MILQGASRLFVSTFFMKLEFEQGLSRILESECQGLLTVISCKERFSFADVLDLFGSGCILGHWVECGTDFAFK